MKRLWLISSAVLFIASSSASSSASATSAPSKPEGECEGGSQMENAECVGAKLNIADQELKATYNAIRTRLAIAVKAANSGGRNASDAAEIDRRLLKSQQAWFAFRQTDCALEGAEMLGGNGEGARIQICELAKTIERIQELGNAAF